MPGMQTLPEHSIIMLDTVSEKYVRFDNEFRFTFVNQAAEVLLGKSRAEGLGTDPSSDCGCARLISASQRPDN
jgi:PAS domain-containing protein